MKKIISIIISLSFLAFVSCSVYEDLYFLENGQMKYNMTIDASELMSIVGQSSLSKEKDYPKDSIINFSQIVRDSLKNISPEIDQELKNIEPLNFRVQNNDSLGILKISLFGDFENFDAFTNALSSISRLESQIKNNKSNPLTKLSANNIFSQNSFSWDGTTLKRTVTAAEEAKDSDDENNGGEGAEKLTKDVDESMTRLFSQGKMVVKYHFPKRVKNVSNEEATYSKDGKTVVLSYPASLFLKPNSDLSVEIITE